MNLLVLGGRRHNDNRFAYLVTRHVDDYNSPMTVFWPENAFLVAVNSAFPRLRRGRFGNLGEEALMVAQFEVVFVGCSLWLLWRHIICVRWFLDARPLFSASLLAKG